MQDAHLDPDDLRVIAEARAAGATLITWDTPLREAAGGLTPYEAMDQAIDEVQGIPELQQGVGDIKALRSLSPRDLTALATAAADTAAYFQKSIHVEGPNTAGVVRQWRVDAGYTWRSVSRMYSTAWHLPFGSNQLAGMALCEQAAKLLGEDFMKAPWN